VLDDENFILSDSYFNFQFDEQTRINWRNIGALHFDAATGTIDNSYEPVNDILLNIDQLAFVDLDRERNTRWIGQDGRKAAKALQCGMQYYMFVQKQMRQRISVLQDYALRQQSELERLQQVYREKRATHKRYRALNERLND